MPDSVLQKPTKQTIHKMTVINRQTIKILDQKESIDSIDNHIDSECLTSTTPVTRMTTFTSSSSSLGNKFLLILSIVYLLSSSSTTISSANITTTPVYSLSLAKNFQPKQLEINSETLETINDNDKYNKIDYTK